jgi:hypothetical protein
MLKQIVFSDRAYTSILKDTAARIETETGGILLGHRRGSIWYVIEALDPGPNSVFTPVTFEYDHAYVNHLAHNINNLYSIRPEILGLWHRHPGSFDTFSRTDDGTNSQFAGLHEHGAISGIVNIDSAFRLTMYQVTLPLRYTRVAHIYGDQYIPLGLLRMQSHVDLSDYIADANNEHLFPNVTVSSSERSTAHRAANFGTSGNNSSATPTTNETPANDETLRDLIKNRGRSSAALVHGICETIMYLVQQFRADVFGLTTPRRVPPQRQPSSQATSPQRIHSQDATSQREHRTPLRPFMSKLTLRLIVSYTARSHPTCVRAQAVRFSELTLDDSAKILELIEPDMTYLNSIGISGALEPGEPRFISYREEASEFGYKPISLKFSVKGNRIFCVFEEVCFEYTPGLIQKVYMNHILGAL